jgi:hypothetical protein
MEHNGARLLAEVSKVVDFTERETGIEPATFSLGIPVAIENKEQRAQRSPILVLQFPKTQ